jgi:hypothetical protein
VPVVVVVWVFEPPVLVWVSMGTPVDVEDELVEADCADAELVELWSPGVVEAEVVDEVVVVAPAVDAVGAAWLEVVDEIGLVKVDATVVWVFELFVFAELEGVPDVLCPVHHCVEKDVVELPDVWEPETETGGVRVVGVVLADVLEALCVLEVPPLTVGWTLMVGWTLIEGWTVIMGDAVAVLPLMRSSRPRPRCPCRAVCARWCAGIAPMYTA